MRQLIACCGLDCETCDARIATINDDNTLREATARKWSAMNQAPEITAETINCLGCRADGVKFGYCAMCAICSCAMDKGFETCGECAELDSCPKIGPILENDPTARTNLASA